MDSSTFSILASIGSQHIDLCMSTFSLTIVRFNITDLSVGSVVDSSTDFFGCLLRPFSWLEMLSNAILNC